MKKILMLLLLAGAGVLVKKKLDQGKNEQNLWADATDTVKPA